MAIIHVLSADTINKIAAGEVVERPVNVVKELVENAIDAGATAVTVEIRNGGIDLIRVTDNGCGIEESQIRNAFRRHATSKINDERDLSRLSTLGFRGEALSSIAAVSQVEMITKTRESLIGTRATNQVLGRSGSTNDRQQIHPDEQGSGNFYRTGADAADAQAASLQTTDIIPLEITEVGCPDGTSVIVRNLFYNVPVRRRFLKTAQTEAGYITDLMQQLALSHPDISFHYRVNAQDKLVTSGNGNEKELIYRIYGRQMSASVIPIRIMGRKKADPPAIEFCTQDQNPEYILEGYLGRPEFSRASRGYEIFFVNDRILHSDVLSKGLEMGYRTDLMQHRFPFAILHLTLPAEEIDVNVHPSKMEVRFTNAKAIYDFLNEGVHATLHEIELIPRTTFGTQQEEAQEEASEAAGRDAALAGREHTEQFERRHLQAQGETIPAYAGTHRQYPLPAAGFDTSKHEDSATSKQTAADSSSAVMDDPLSRAAGHNSHDVDKDASQKQQEAPAVSPGHVFTPYESGEKAVQSEFLFEDNRPYRGEGGILLAPDTAAPAEAKKETFFLDASGQEATDKRTEHASSKDQLLPSDRTAAGASRPTKEADVPDAHSAGDFIAAAAREAGDRTYTEDYADAAYGPLKEHFLSKEHIGEWHIIGQVFKTYWIIEYRDKMLLIDQHAAHEKVNFERLMGRLSKEQQSPAASQLLSPPLIISLTGKEEGAYLQYQDVFRRMGYEIEDFGQGSYAIRAVPLELYANEPDALLREVLDEILEEKMSGTPAAILYKIASMSCKAAVKGNTTLSLTEAKALIGELLSLDNPYHCPHGRPTMVVLSQKDLERKFKRIV